MRTMKSELKKWQRKNNQKVTNSKVKKTKKKTKENYSDSFWREMMGMGRPRYERRRGSVRQK